MSVSNRLYRQKDYVPKNQPLKWKPFFLEIVAKDAVMWIALVLAGASSVVVRPTFLECLDFIDAKTLACLASLMVASGGFMISGAFDAVAARMADQCRSARALMATMVFSTFFASMLVTNDVALIVFVPMTLLAYKRIGRNPLRTVVLQTVAANVGSSLLPMGNPQNLYLFSYYHMDFAGFVAAVLPLVLSGGVVLVLFCLFEPNTPVMRPGTVSARLSIRDIGLYGAVFVVAVLAVFGAMDYRIAFAFAVAAMFWKGRFLAQQVDYSLLLTFIGFFIFVGNIARIEEVEAFLASLVGPNPFMAAVVSSQVISNVPTAVLLSGFTEDAGALLAGVNAGGCGTLIASMASLISYKLFVRDQGNRRAYLLCFTIINVVFLFVMICASMINAGFIA